MISLHIVNMGHRAHSDINVVYRPSYRNGQVELHIPYGNKAT